MAKQIERKTYPREAVNFPDWSKSNGSYIAGASCLDEVDTVARQMEERWGADRLRLLPQIPTEMREKFDRQRFLLQQAIWHGGLEDVRLQASRMVRAWQVLDRVASEAGATPLPPTVWETTLADGRVLAVVRTDTDAVAVERQGRAVTVVSLEEFARVVDAWPSLLSEARRVFPGAKVTAVRPAGDRLKGAPMPEMPIDWRVGDEMPF